MNILAAGPSRSQSPPSAIQTPSRSSVQHRKGYQSPCPGDEPEKVESAILKVVDNLIQKNEKDKWKVFFRLKGDPETASNMVARYRFVQDLMDKHVGKVVPFKSTADYIIEEKHILGALQIVDEDGRFASNCTETLELLKLYGKDGERSEDPEVVKLLEDQDLAYNAKPIKRLLRLLRGADEKWIQEHPAS
ncbi:hypothetical protein EST38_g9077 [Candolleomyces aberdarensis]|uniref:Uncharacterized protein n=1 Tax=Candolleomyces aberdarensis TaxID=2316362 RepID=A0A4Q2DCM1_9AGAR|nr:hypothetical protein EST38_g9077 [Candolleomyces aberdarensis]